MNKVPVMRKATTVVNQYQEGISAREVALLIEEDATVVSNALLNGFARGLIARKKVAENRGPAGGARYKYYPLSTTDEDVVKYKPTAQFNQPTVTHEAYVETMQLSDFEAIAAVGQAPVVQVEKRLPFTLEVVTQYKMVFDNGTVLDLSQAQYDAMKSLTGE